MGLCNLGNRIIKHWVENHVLMQFERFLNAIEMCEPYAMVPFGLVAQQWVVVMPTFKSDMF